MWGKMLCQPKQMVNLTTKIVMSANIWTLKSHKHWLVAEDFGPSFLYEMTIGVESASMCKPCLGVPLMLKKS